MDAKIAGRARHVYVAGRAQRRASLPEGYSFGFKGNFRPVYFSKGLQTEKAIEYRYGMCASLTYPDTQWL